jgi:hypothetical protein
MSTAASTAPATVVFGLPLNLVIAVASALAVLILSLVLLHFCRKRSDHPDLIDIPDLPETALKSPLATQAEDEQCSL